MGLGGSEKSLLRRIKKTAQEFYELADGPNIDAIKVGENLDTMAVHLEKARLSNSPAFILSVEATILSVDKLELTLVIERDLKQGKAISPYIKADITSLNDGLRQIGRASGVFALRARYGEDAYHDIATGSRSEKDVDADGTANDVLRQSCKSHGTRLQNMARGVSKTELDRKAQFVIGKRRENIVTCETLYKIQQREFVKRRAKSRG
ncbi:MAG: hypothetical protein LIQ31_00765 [Planctomycetes bacterium]|nr:hypothetical protein [Planctomycetota bacterium]